MRIFLVIAALLFSGNAMATSALSANQIYQLNNQMGAVAHQIQLGTKLGTIDSRPAIDDGHVSSDMIISPATEGLNIKRVARVVWDPSGDSTMGSSTVDSGVHGLGVSLPANALITDSYAYVVTQVAGATSQVGFQCEDSNNILAQTDLTGKAAGTIFSGKQYGVASTAGNDANMIAAIASECEISAKVDTAPVTAGKVILFLEYMAVE